MCVCVCVSVPVCLYVCVFGSGGCAYVCACIVGMFFKKSLICTYSLSEP